MPLRKQPPAPGTVIELATDPAADPDYRVNARSLWLDTSQTPAVLRERNAANTAWLVTRALGRFTDEFTVTTGQTTATLTYTPASQADITAHLGIVKQDPANITGLSGKVVTFGAMPASANGRSLYLEYTRID